MNLEEQRAREWESDWFKQRKGEDFSKPREVFFADLIAFGAKKERGRIREMVQKDYDFLMNQRSMLHAVLLRLHDEDASEATSGVPKLDDAPSSGQVYFDSVRHQYEQQASEPHQETPPSEASESAAGRSSSPPKQEAPTSSDATGVPVVQKEPRPGDQYRHRNEKLYTFLSVAKSACSRIPAQDFAVYRDIFGIVYTWPLSEFLDGRFTKVE